MGARPSVSVAQFSLSLSNYYIIGTILGYNIPLNNEVLLRCKYHNPWIRIRYAARLI
ncbi:hypothetical protein HanIR_Chr03g0148731 [Helianthus annuus]|nr:hypothetical protein HanIR_Chr03g0148731 [Helianthus annuus]